MSLCCVWPLCGFMCEHTQTHGPDHTSYRWPAIVFEGIPVKANCPECHPRRMRFTIVLLGSCIRSDDVQTQVFGDSAILGEYYIAATMNANAGCIAADCIRKCSLTHRKLTQNIPNGNDALVRA